MDLEVYRIPRKKQRSCCLLISTCSTAVLVVIVLAVSLALTFDHPTDSFKLTFITRCENFTGKSERDDCQKIWNAFEQSYVGQDPCNVPMEAYDPLLATTDLEPACNRMMFWSKTKDLVHEFTTKRDCFLTLEDSLLGSVAYGLTWCGKEGSNETFTTGCPEWTECDNNPVRSFWSRVSAAFADVACGDVTVMLNGSIAVPFSPTSIFATIEVKRFNSTRMRGLSVLLVTEENYVTNCTNPSLMELQKDLDPNITYRCQGVMESKIQDCISRPDTRCGACW